MQDFQTKYLIKGLEVGLLKDVDSFSIKSHYDQHHTFQLNLNIEADKILKLQEIENLLGEAITIIYSIEEEVINKQVSQILSKKGTFKGFIDNINTSWNEHGEQHLSITGYSPTVLLDTGSNLKAFSDKSLDHIAQQLLKGSRIKYSLSSKAKEFKFDWTVQAMESALSYLKRLCDITAKLECYYDGEQLLIDDITSGENAKEIKLVEGENLSHLAVSFDTFPQKFTLSAYDYITDKVNKVPATPLETKSKLIKLALDKSNYGTQSFFVPHFIKNKNQLKKMATRMAASQATDLLLVSGSTTDPRIKVGSQLRIETSKQFLEGELGNQLFTVINVQHSYHNSGVYSNSFTVIPSNLPYNLRMSYSTPYVGTLCAVVKKNEGDPDHLGRVCVILKGDDNKSVSPWIPVLQPHTGKGGFYFKPQVGDHVMVTGDLENGMMVIGSIYTGKQNAQHWESEGVGFHGERCDFIMKDGKLIIRADEILISSSGMKLEADRIDLDKK